MTDVADMHACEALDCVNRYFPDGERMAEFLTTVEKSRGKPAADKLRQAAREVWRQRARGSRIADHIDAAAECFYQERAGILEHMSGFTRTEAERRARIEADAWKARKLSQGGND